MSNNDIKWEDLLNAALGAVLLTKDKIVSEVDKILEKQDIGAETKEDIKSKLIQRAEQERKDVTKTLQEALEKKITEAGFVRKKDVEELEGQLEQLERRVEELEE